MYVCTIHTSDALQVLLTHVNTYTQQLLYCHATVKPPRKYPIPSELGSQTWLGQTSTELRDHLGTLGAVVYCQFIHAHLRVRIVYKLKQSYHFFM